MINPLNTKTQTFTFNCKAVSPIHIGVDSNKDYEYGIDYVLDESSKKYLFFHLNQLILQLDKSEVQNISTAIIKKDSSYLFKILKPFIDNPKIVYKKHSKLYEMNDGLQKCIHDGFGKAFLPGSSLKGSISSILLSKFIKNKNSSYPTKEVFGDLKNNNMSMLHVSDTYFEGENITKFYRTKILCAHQDRFEKYAQWKNARKDSYSDIFNDTGFVTIYECIPAKTKGKIKISLPNLKDSTLDRKIKEHLHHSEQLKMYSSPSQLIEIFREHTNSYLDKEIEFFKTYENDYTENIIEKLKSYKELNSSSNKALIRVGTGVGFHSITGDWQEKSLDHISAESEFKNQIFNKSRKLLFFTNKAGDFSFFPMGFLEISIP